LVGLVTIPPLASLTALIAARPVATAAAIIGKLARLRP